MDSLKWIHLTILLVVMTMVRCRAENTWGQWSEYSHCNVTCGNGFQNRNRKCLDTNCVGPSHESIECRKLCIPLSELLAFYRFLARQRAWTEWSEWTGCSVSCGSGGKRNRRRQCVDYRLHQSNEAECGGDYEEVEDCASSVPCPSFVDDGHEDFADSHMAEIQEFVQQESQTTTTTPPPPIHGEWGSWSVFTSCDAICGKGSKRRTRSCDNPAPSNGGDDCEGFDEEVEECREKDCVKWSEWEPYDVCSVSCGNGTRARWRTCEPLFRESLLVDVPEEDMKCPGSETEKVDCVMGPCRDCNVNNGLCHQNCLTNSNGQVYCDCIEGYVLNEDGFNCDDIDECSGNHNCDGTCINFVGNYFCFCNKMNHYWHWKRHECVENI